MPFGDTEVTRANTSHHQDVWHATITDLVEHFRLALTSLVPAAEAAAIPWKDEEAYDDWDGLASELYRLFVVRPIICDPRNTYETLPLPPYGMHLSSYEDY